MRKVIIGYSHLAPLTVGEAADQIIAWAASETKALVVTPNVDHIVQLERDDEFRSAYRLAAMQVADGMPLVWLSRIMRQPLPERVTGADLLPALAHRASVDGLPIALVGGVPGVAARAARRLEALAPNLQVVLVAAPPIGFHNDLCASAELAASIAQAGPALTFLALGTPKQEKWVAQWWEELPPSVYLGIGAAVDFAAGRVRRAPAPVQRRGLEWAWRLAHDPKRLAKRYLYEDLKFVPVAARSVVAARRLSHG